MAQHIAVERNQAAQKQCQQIKSQTPIGYNADLNFEKLSFEDFKQIIQQMEHSFNSRRVTRCLFRLKPVFEQFNTFERAISSLAQAQANPISLIWGILQVLLRCICSVLNTIELITTLLCDLTENLTRINNYIKLLPSNQKLQTLCVEICDGYVDCFISAIEFYNHRPFVTLIKSIVMDPGKPLREAYQRIHKNIDHFDKETKLRVDQRILTRLPEEIPVQVSIPKTGLFVIPYPKNDFFHGREADLEHVHGQLRRKRNQHETVSCLIHAIGGMGKTQIASEYAHRYRREYQCIFWLGSENKDSLAVSYASIAENLQVHGLQTMGQGGRIEMVKNWFETTDITWLLIFDNVESEKSIMPFYPKSNGSVIVTSQIQAFPRICRSRIQLKPMTTDEGASLLLKHLHTSQGSEDLSSAEKLVDILGCMPIAIAHIAGVMFDSQMTISEAIEGLLHRQEDLLWSSDETLSTRMERGMNQVWSLAVKELTPEALNLLEVLSMLSADKIQEDMLLTRRSPGSTRIGLAPDLYPSLQTRIKLAKRQLVQRNTDSPMPYLSIHRSLQLFIRHTLNQDLAKRQVVFSHAVALLRECLPPQHVIQTPSNESWSAYEKYLPHVLSLKVVYEQTQPPLDAPPEFASILSDAANYFWELGRYGPAQQMARLAVSIFEKQLAQTNLMELASAYAIWGEAAAEEGICGRETWLRCSSKAIELRKEFLYAEHIGGTLEEQLLYANSYNDFGAYLIHVGNYEQAEPYIEHSLAIKAVVSTEDTQPMMFAEGYQNLAVIHAARKDHLRAKELISKSIELGTKANGVDAAATWTFHFDSANLALARHDYNEALTQHLAVREKRIAIFGKYGSRTRDSYHAVAVAYQGLRQYDKAENILNCALENLDESPWHDAGVARAKHLLAQVLKLQNHPHRAQKLEIEANILRHKLLSQPEDWLAKDVDDSMILYDYMMGYRAGRPSLGQTSIKPFDPNAVGISPTIIMLKDSDKCLPIQTTEGRCGNPDGSGNQYYSQENP